MRFYLQNVVFFLLGLACLANAASQQMPPVVAAALRAAGIPAGAIGTYVQEVGSAKPLIASNADLPLNPASTMKLLTTNAALELLGPTFTWKTTAYASGAQVGDVLQGDLIIKGSGDPKLVLENFWLFLRQIRAKGIRQIDGNLLLDRSAFEDNVVDPNKFDGDPSKPYNVGPDALLLNYKSIHLRFAANEVGGVNVNLDPPLAGYAVLAPKLRKGECEDWQTALRANINGDNASFTGGFSSACGEKDWYVHPYKMSHTQYFAAVFRQLWQELGGVFKGDVKNGTAPANATFLTEWESISLPEVIRDINKFSNNVMARQLLLTLGVDGLKTPTNPERGAQAVKNWLAAKGIAAPDLVIENGSGLSRNERVSAATMGRMLVAAFRSPIMPEFISSMPLVGYDGTMRKRLKSHGVAGNAHIKSGSLNDVRSVAGYVLAASGKRYALVSIINHTNAARGRDAHDALLQWVYEHG